MKAFGNCIGILLASGLLLVSLPATAARDGVYWEISSEMEGMPFALPKQKVCTPKGSKEPPVGKDDSGCKVLDKRTAGNRFYWKAQCKEGLMEGDFTYNPDSYTGNMKVTHDGQLMKMKVAGRNLHEACTDDSEERLAANKALGAKIQADNAAALQQVEAAKAQSCAEALDKMTGFSIIDLKACPKQVPTYCRNLATPAGYEKAWQADGKDMGVGNPNGFSAHLQACKLDAAVLLPKLCPVALKQEEVAFLADHCPTEKQLLVRKYCEGRKSTSDIDPKFLDFCTGNATFGGASEKSAPMRIPGVPLPQTGSDSSAMPSTDSLIDGAKKLKGLLGF